MRNTFNFFKKKLNLLLVLNVVMCVMVLLNAFCICWTSYRNGHLGLLTRTHCCFSWTLGASSKWNQFFYWYYFGRCSSNWLGSNSLFTSLFSSTLYAGFMIFLSPFLDSYVSVYVNNFVLHTARHSNYLSAERF